MILELRVTVDLLTTLTGNVWQAFSQVKPFIMHHHNKFEENIFKYTCLFNRPNFNLFKVYM